MISTEPIDTMTRTTGDQMAVTMARLLKPALNVFHGLASPLPAVAIALARRLHNPALEYLNIAGGVNIAPGALEVSTCSPRFLTGSESFFSLTDIFDLSARGELDVAFLGGVQVDRKGRINNSVIGSFSSPKVKLPGGAGSAAIVPTAKHIIVWRTRHDIRSIVDHCDFVTAEGNVEEVVTPLGILEKKDGELVISKWFTFSSIESIQENTGFPITVSDDGSNEPEPTEEELRALSEVDPQGVRFSEF
jgi:glutaconate CoA-transferase, subunit B